MFKSYSYISLQWLCMKLLLLSATPFIFSQCLLPHHPGFSPGSDCIATTSLTKEECYASISALGKEKHFITVGNSRQR